MKFLLLSMAITFGVTGVTDPIGLGWGIALCLAVSLAILGAFFDAHANHKVGNRIVTFPLFASLGMSAIAAFAMFSILRTVFTDSLQVAAFSGVCGMFGQRVLKPLADSIFNKLGVTDERDDTR